MKKYKSKFSEKTFTFDRMTPKPDHNGYYTLVFKDEQGRELYPLLYSAKYLGKYGHELAKIASEALGKF